MKDKCIAIIEKQIIISKAYIQSIFYYDYIIEMTFFFYLFSFDCQVLKYCEFMQKENKAKYIIKKYHSK